MWPVRAWISIADWALEAFVKAEDASGRRTICGFGAVSWFSLCYRFSYALSGQGDPVFEGPVRGGVLSEPVEEILFSAIFLRFICFIV